MVKSQAKKNGVKEQKDVQKISAVNCKVKSVLNHKNIKKESLIDQKWTVFICFPFIFIDIK